VLLLPAVVLFIARPALALFPIVIDRVGDAYNVYGVINGKRLPAEDIVYRVPGRRPVTLKEYVDQLLMGLGWLYLRRGGDLLEELGKK